MISRRLVVSVALGAAVAAMAAVADAQCYRHEECPADQLCLEQTCSDPDEPLDTCGDADDCSGGSHWLCDDGYCKMDGVYCQNPAGHGYEENEWGHYSCEDGLACDWIAEEPPDVLADDEELYARCLENLVSSCGEEAPDINDECTPEQLAACEDYFDWIEQLQTACDQETEEVGFFQMASCCHDLEDGDEWFQDALDCVMGLALEDCADLPDCYPDDDDMGSSDSDSDVDEDDDQDADSGGKDAGGCRLAPRAVCSPSLIGLLLRFL